MTFLTILGVTEILCSFRLVLAGKTEVPESSKLEFLKFLENNFALSENTSRLLNSRGIANLPLLKTLAIDQKS